MSALSTTRSGPVSSEAPLPTPATPIAGRLASLDVFRGVVILTMLVVNNIGDDSVVGYFWQHADWQSRPLATSLRQWGRQLHSNGLSSLSDFPLLRNCTLADYVMPMFMLIIGIALPFAAAGARRRGLTGPRYWLNVVRRGLTIYALGWCIDLSLAVVAWRWSSNPNEKLVLVLGMNVLQLLGLSFILARVVYCLPLMPRLAVAGALYLGHWALLRFVPQGSLPAGTFTETHNVPGYLYGSLTIFKSVPILSWLKFNIVGMLSVPPAVATITLGTWIGDVLRDPQTVSPAKIRRLLIGAALLVGIGLVWSCDLPMNKPRWTPCYLIYCAGVGSFCTAALYGLIDVRGLRKFAWPFTVFGVNAIGIYFLSIMAKIWLLMLPHYTDAAGASHNLVYGLIATLQRHLDPWAGSWAFTILYIGTIWCFAAFAYQKRLIWKV